MYIYIYTHTRNNTFHGQKLGKPPSSWAMVLNPHINSSGFTANCKGSHHWMDDEEPYIPWFDHETDGLKTRNHGHSNHPTQG